MTKQEDIVESFFMERNSATSTRDNYTIAFKYYTQCNGMSMQELLDEADAEEDAGVRWKRCTLKRRLLEFRTYIYSEVRPSTAKLYFNSVRTFYRHFEVQVGDLPYMKVQKEYTLKHEDIPTKDDIKRAYGFASPLLRAVILFISSSGCGRTETHNLTVGDFMKATDEFSNNSDIIGRCNDLLLVNDAIPIWEIHRQKTDKQYYTFCSTEALHEICSYLLARKDTLTSESKLFKINIQYLNVKFKQLNKKLGGIKCGTWSKFRMHTLRKFNASALINAEENAWTIEEVDSIQGRSKDATHRSYFLEDPAKLREKYRLVVSELTILSDTTLVSELAETKSQKEMLEAEMQEHQRQLNVMMEEMKKLQAILNVE